MTRHLSLMLLTLTLATAVAAEDSSGRAAVGGGLGGAAGAYVGSELGGRSGAIVGSAIGAATGTAIATDGQKTRERVVVREAPPVPSQRYYYHEPHREHFCPPGQAKKGRC
jgi:hypothetical protein